MGTTMPVSRFLLVACALVALVSCAPITQSPVSLATFDGTSGTTFKWSALNDPVMGGASTSTFVEKNGEGIFNGTCRIVSFLHAPGFAKATTQNGWIHKNKFNDASAFLDGALLLNVRSSTPGYLGFKAEFGSAGLPAGRHGAGSFKANFNVTGTDWQTVSIPFNHFSSDWSDFTGRCDTKDPNGGKQHVCCSSEHPEVCPAAKHLRQITSLAVWAEGVAGDFHIEVKSIAAGPKGA